MKKNIQLGICLTLIGIILLLMPIVSHGQVKDPKVPRTWWNSVKSYIDSKSQNMVWTVPAPFSSRGYNSGSSADTVLVFTPGQDIEIQSISVWLNNNGTPDSTIYLILAHERSDTLLTIDSTGNGFIRYWESINPFTLTASLPCTLIYTAGSDSAYFENPVITIQSRNR